MHSYRLLISKSIILSLLISLFFILQAFSNGMEVTYNPSLWNSDGEKKVSALNTTNKPLTYDGIRLTMHNINGINLVTEAPASSVTNIVDGNDGNNRYEVRIPPKSNAENRILPGQNKIFPLRFYQWGFSDDWTPSNRQFLIKTGTFGVDKGFKDIKGITIDTLKILIQNDWFYDPTLYVPDSLGINGGKYSGGFIDTWYDQDGDSALWQVQICLPEEPSKNEQLWNGWYKFNPGIMGDETGTGAYAGTGPHYAMGLVMIQEYMHVDMQLVAGMSAKESNAGLEEYTNLGANFGASMGSSYKTFNTDGELGTAHYIKTSYGEYIRKPYPKFFPYTTLTQEDGSRYFINTPGYGAGASGNTVGNCPQLSNSLLIGTLYMWNGYELIFNAATWTGKFISDAADDEIAAKLYAWGWNRGFGSSWYQQIGWENVKNMTDITPICVEYVQGALHTSHEMEKAVGNSEVIGGSAAVYDPPISKKEIEEQFFGTGGDGSTGQLGTGGIFWHFDLSEEKRAEIWSDLDEAFELLKGRAPTPGVSGTNNISLRYDYLALLRIVKWHLDLEIPIPSDLLFINKKEEFITFLKTTDYADSTFDENKIVVENNYPFLVKESYAVNNNGTIEIRVNVEDDSYLDINNDNPKIMVVSWTLDSNWGNWQPAKYLSGDTSSAKYLIEVPKESIIDYYGDGVNSGTGSGMAWMKVDDRNFNSTIDSFWVSLELPKYPSLDSAELTDLNGDGLGDKVTVFIKKGEAVDADELNTVSTVEYSWPDPGSPNGVNNSDIDFSNSTSWDFDVTNLVGAGLGEITFDYPSKSNYSTSILDKVGPAIKDSTPVYKVSSAGDTLELSFTEEIEDLVGNGPFLTFKGSSPTPVTPQSISGKGKDWKFVFNNGDLATFDSVKIIHTSTLTDTAGNSAADNNQWVYIKKQGNNDPSWKKSYVKDLNGNGNANELTIEISPGDGPSPLTINDLVKVTYEWPGGTGTIELTTISATTDSTLKITLSPDVSGSGNGTVSLDFGSYTINSKTINDSIGPVIDSAGYNEKKIGDTSNDTLHIVISEALKNSLTANTEYINLKTVSGTVTKTEVISAVNTTGNNWILVLASGAVGDNDSVNFATGTNIEDNYGNDVQSNNQYVPIDKQGGKLPNIEKAYIKDTNGDGIGDEIKFSIVQGNAKDAYDLADCDSLKFKWPDGNPYKNITSGLSGTEATITSNIDSAGDGSGLIVLFFPDDENISSSIIDSIGPAISTAYYKEVVDEPCSLQVVFTEPITDNLQDNTAYLNIKSVGGSASSVISSTAIQVGIDGLTWIFVLPANSISSGDSVNLISSSGLIDQAFSGDDQNNTPHPNNIMVEIEFESDLYTLDANKSSYWDKDADGIMDNVLLTFKGKSISDSIIDLMTFLIEWPNKDGNNITMVAEGDDFTISGQTINWDVSGYDLQPDLTIITDSSNYGGVIMIQPVDDSIGSIDTSSKYTGLQDKMAPVLVSADYYINNTGDGVDSLFVTFSEEITQNIANLKPFIFDEDNYEIELISPLGAWVSSKNITFTNIGSTTPNDGDSININSFANIKGSIEQNNPLNKKIELNVYLEITVEQVEFYDTDNRPDGRIDLIKVLTDTAVSDEILSNLANNISLPTHRNFNSISASDIVGLTDENGFEIHVSQNLAFDDLGWSLVSTSTTDADTISITGKVAHDKFMLRPATYKAIDSLAPVITKGILMPAFIDESNYLENVQDTVMVNFSEKINDINNDEPFNFIIGGTSVAMTLSDSGLTPNGNAYRFIIVDNKDEVIMENDSVQIDDNGGISDINGIVQSKNSYPVPFTIGDYKYAYKLIVYPNPLLRSNEKQLEEKKEAFEQLGIPEEYATENTIAVMVRPYGYVLNSNDIETKITIFDMVGNRIVNNKKLEFQQTNSKQIWYYIWDTMNTKKRLVGNGVYLGQINMKDKDGAPQNIPPAKIGVGE